MILSFSKKRGLVILCFCVAGLVISLVPNLWFKWSLGKTHNIPLSDRQDRQTDRLCLVFALDGVPFDIMDQLYEQGYFKGFHPPGRLISTFPSLTRPSFSKLLVGGKPFGYERLYFDHQANQIQGFHLAQKIFKAKADAPDYHPKLHFLGFPGYIAYVFPDQFTQTAIDTFKDKLLHFKGTEFIAYMGFSDAIAHVHGKTGQMEFLKRISHVLDDVRTESGRLMDVVVFSDHGNNFKPNIRVDLADVLEKAGFHDTDQLNSATDIILLRNGFVSVAAIYSFPETAPAIAQTLSTVEGVDFSVYKSGPSVVVHGADGMAQIDHQPGMYRYKPLTGDPLGLSPILNPLIPTGSNGFIPVEKIWQATKTHIYPDPLDRIWQALHSLVQHPATVVVSFEDGYAFGPFIFDNTMITGRKSTHGALLYNHSYGFFMTDFKPVNPYNRPQKVAALLADAARQKSDEKQ